MLIPHTRKEITKGNAIAWFIVCFRSNASQAPYDRHSGAKREEGVIP